MIVQDTFREFVLPRIDSLVAQNVVLGTSAGKILITSLGLAMSVNPSQVTFHLKMVCSDVQECAAILADPKYKKADKYPILVLNARGIKYEGDIVTIPEMMLATWTVQTYKAADRDIKTIKPILSTLSLMLENTLRDVFNVESDFHLTSEIVYNGAMSEMSLSDKVDAILFTNTKLQLIKNC